MTYLFFMKLGQNSFELTIYEQISALDPLQKYTETPAGKSEVYFWSLF